MKRAVYCDWLAIQYLGVPVSVHPWRFDLRPYGCKEFRMLYDVYFHDQLFGVLSAVPSLPVLDPNLCILKVENRFLYCDALEDSLRAFRVDNGFTYKGLSRVDVCADFNSFSGGRKPENVIRNFVTGKWCSLNKMESQLNFGRGGLDVFKALAFGSRRSDVRVYLYDKKLEMQEQGFKTWIQGADELNGVSWAGDVWRLEVSLRGDSKKWINPENGEELDVSLDNVLNNAWLGQFYDGLVAKYFSFTEASQSKNRYRQKKVPLFDSCSTAFRRLRERDGEDVNRADRIFLKKLHQEIAVDGARDWEDRPLIINWAHRWAARHRLTEFALEKCPSISW